MVWLTTPPPAALRARIAASQTTPGFEATSAAFVVANTLPAAAFLLEALLAAQAQGWRPRISVREPQMLYRALGFAGAFTNALSGANLWGCRAAGALSQAYDRLTSDACAAAGTLFVVVYAFNQSLGLSDLAHRAGSRAAGYRADSAAALLPKRLRWPLAVAAAARLAARYARWVRPRFWFNA